MEGHEGIVTNEGEIRERVKISPKILTELAEETTIKSKEDSGESFSFILEKGASQVIVRIGIGHSWGVSYTPQMAVDRLRPFVDEGFRVVADYHNHPPESVRVYTEVGMPPEQAFTPSYADIISEVPAKLKDELNQQEFPHLIGVYLEGAGGVFINGFKYVREPTVDEESQIKFDDPFYVETEKDESGIQLLAGNYTNPKALLEKGIIIEVEISSSLGSDQNIRLNTNIRESKP